MLLCEAEVSNDGSPVTKEDIGEFKIPMQITSLSHLNETCYDILHNLEHFLLADPSPFLEEAAEIALVAVLSDDEAVGGFADHIIALQDIGMLNFSEGLDLAI